MFKSLVAPFEEGSLILVLQNFVKFYLFFMFSYIQNFVCPAQKFEKFKFWRASFWENPHFGTLISVMFNLFLIISTHSENLIHLALMV